MPEVPNFGKLLAPYMSNLPPAAQPAFLARLERGAANRYREWAKLHEGAARDELLACAEREERIADSVDTLFPVSDEEREKIEAAMPAALETYASIFEDVPLRDQLEIQAAAELQGAAAWKGIREQQSDPKVRQALEVCSALEEETSAAVSALLAG